MNFSKQTLKFFNDEFRQELHYLFISYLKFSFQGNVFLYVLVNLVLFRRIFKFYCKRKFRRLDFRFSTSSWLQWLYYTDKLNITLTWLFDVEVAKIMSLTLVVIYYVLFKWQVNNIVIRLTITWRIRFFYSIGTKPVFLWVIMPVAFILGTK